MRLEIECKVLPYEPEELTAWEKNERAWCPDHRCREKGWSKAHPTPQGAGGYAEAVVGRYLANKFELEWVHQEFDVFGVNLDQKYPRTQAILEAHLYALALGEGCSLVAQGEDRVKGMRRLNRLLGPLNAPDIMAWGKDGSGLRFAEAKLVKPQTKHADDLDVSDKFKNKAERWGLLVLARYYKVPVEVYWVVPEGQQNDFEDVKAYEL